MRGQQSNYINWGNLAKRSKRLRKGRSVVTNAFFLAGPLGLSAAEAVIAISELSADSGFVVGSTPGLQVNYEERLLRFLNERNATILPEQIALDEAERIVCVGWRKLLKREQNVFVVHDSLLPKFRGWNPLVTAIEFGFEESGLTLFQASGEVDAGPIIEQKTFPFPPEPSIKRVLEVAGEVLSELIAYYSRAIRKPLSLRYQNSEEATISLWRDDLDYEIDWTQSSQRIHWFVASRGWPYLGARTRLDGTFVRVLRSFPVREEITIINATPGKVLRIEPDGPVVVCGQGLLKVSEIVDESHIPVRLSKVRTRFS